jgi:hypothetical protein
MRGIMGRRLGRVGRGWRRQGEGVNHFSFGWQSEYEKSVALLELLLRKGCGVSDITHLTHGMRLILPTPLIIHAISSRTSHRVTRYMHSHFQVLQLCETTSGHYCVRTFSFVSHLTWLVDTWILVDTLHQLATPTHIVT